MAVPATCSTPSSVGANRRAIRATEVPERLRLRFLPRVFGARYFLQGELGVYGWMDSICPDYHGGFWNFYDLSNGGFYLAPKPDSSSATEDDARLRVRTPSEFEGRLSHDAAGVVATLYCINSLIWKGAEHLYDSYYHLRAFAAEHPESRQIFRAID